jgi:hypothetical protein
MTLLLTLDEISLLQHRCNPENPKHLLTLKILSEAVYSITEFVLLPQFTKNKQEILQHSIEELLNWSLDPDEWLDLGSILVRVLRN